MFTRRNGAVCDVTQFMVRGAIPGWIGLMLRLDSER